MVTISIKEHLEMHFVFAMDGTLPLYPPHVFVVPRLPSTMHSTAIVVDFLHWGITRSATLLPVSWRKSVLRCVLSLLCNLSLVRCSNPGQLMLRTTPDRTSERRVSGVDNNMCTSTLKCLTQTLPRIRKNSYYLCTELMSAKREGSMRTVSLTSSMVHSRPSYSPLLEAWDPQPVVYRRLASLISSKHNNLYSRTILFIHSKISFALLRLSLHCLRGSRSTFTIVPSDINIDLALFEGKVTY